MRSGNAVFRDMRRKVIQPTADKENIPINPLTKRSFLGLRKNQPDVSPLRQRLNTSPNQLHSQIQYEKILLRSKKSSSKDCNRFSMLLESKGYSNSGSVNKYEPQSCRNETKLSFKSINSKKSKEEPQTDKIAEKCRDIKQKPYFSSRKSGGELNSLNKLKDKLISPLRKKIFSEPEPSKKQKSHEESVISESDLVNMSKMNDESVNFDMSPCL